MGTYALAPESPMFNPRQLWLPFPTPPPRSAGPTALAEWAHARVALGYRPRLGNGSLVELVDR